MRKNILEPKHLEAIKKRHEFSILPKEITKLYTHNVDVDRVNNDELKKINSKNEIFEMNSHGKKHLVENLKVFAKKSN